MIHAQRADRQGNVQLWGIAGVQKEAVLAAKRSLVTVEEIVETLRPMPDQVVLPSWAVTRIAHVPGGAKPSYAYGYYDRDNAAYQAWDAISSTVTRERFAASTASFCTPAIPHSWTLPCRSARWAWITATSGFSAAPR